MSREREKPATDRGEIKRKEKRIVRNSSVLLIKRKIGVCKYTEEGRHAVTAVRIMEKCCDE